MTVTAAVIGASGYGSREVFSLLARHPGAKLTCATAREKEPTRVSDLHPVLRGRVDILCEEFDPDVVAAKAKVAFLGLPHGAAAAAAKPLLERGVRVIDLSADYRLRDPLAYAEWYGASHHDVENLAKAVYGLPEIYGDDIAPANLIANPGCYPTSAILGLAPLLAGGLVEPVGIVVDSKSGVSGAGRTPKLTTHFPECNESVSAYGVGVHRHMPEMEQVLGDVAGGPVKLLFVPHLIPMDRGILSTIYSRPVRPLQQSQVLELYREFYRGKPFVRVREDLPSTKDTVGTNFCDVTVRIVKDVVVTVACLDNLLKGAAGAAVQNFNRMFGFEETTALL